MSLEGTSDDPEDKDIIYDVVSSIVSSVADGDFDGLPEESTD